MTRAERARRVLEMFKATYPDAHCALEHRNAFELLAATILSAQCTDVRVNMVTPHLFKRFPTPAALAATDAETVEEIIRSTGFYRNKAKSLLGMARRLVEVYGGEVPRTMEDLLSLPGVARKTANVVLGNAYGINEGVVVDTHVQRLSQRIGFTTRQDPVKIEQDLMKVFPRGDWTLLSHMFIDHGRGVCSARSPRCADCALGKELCRSFEPDPARWKSGAAERARKPGQPIRGRAGA